MRRTEPGALRRAADAIRNRRLACADSALDALPDDPFGVTGYVNSHRKVPRRVLEADVDDALAIIRCLHAELDEREHALIGLARSLDFPWRRIASGLGATSPQGGQQRFLRLEAWRAGQPRSDKAARELRTAGETEAEWLARNAAQVRNCAVLAGAAGAGLPRYEELASAIEDVLEALEDDAAPQGLLATLSLAARAHDGVPWHVHGLACEALAMAAVLAEEWHELAGNDDY